MRRIRFHLSQRSKPFRLFVTSEAPDVPAERWFRSLNAALRALNSLDDKWKEAAWVIEYREHHGTAIGGIPLVRNVVHIKHGQPFEEASPQ